MGDAPLAKLPEIKHGGQIIAWLNELGVVEQGQPLSWQEINAWKQATGTAATTEELLLIRKLSREYAAQYARSDDPYEPAPNRARNIDQAALAAQVKSALRAAAKQRK